jgi:hypothetical protein
LKTEKEIKCYFKREYLVVKVFPDIHSRSKNKRKYVRETKVMRKSEAQMPEGRKGEVDRPNYPSSS